MAHYKSYSYNEVKHREIRFDELIQPGTLEYTIHSVMEQNIDRSIIRRHAIEMTTMVPPAYDPAILLKIVLYGYACGMISSRRIAKACRENRRFIALAAGAQPHFTTLAHVVSSMGRGNQSGCSRRAEGLRSAGLDWPRAPGPGRMQTAPRTRPRNGAERRPMFARKQEKARRRGLRP